MKTINQQFDPAIPITDLLEHPDNPRHGDAKAVSESMSANGFYGAILVQKSTNRVIAGHTRLRVARDEGAETIPGIWLDVTDGEARKILLADNRTSDLVYYDDEALFKVLAATLADDGTLLGTGYDDDTYKLLIGTEGVGQLLDDPTAGGSPAPSTNPYTQAVNVPQYQITGEKPDVGDLINTTRTNELVKEIDSHDLPPEVAGFLKLAATRHTVFDYGKIAEFYAHATPEVQRLMENSVLVIIDYKDAMRLGCLAFEGTINELLEDDELLETGNVQPE